MKVLAKAKKIDNYILLEIVNKKAIEQITALITSGLYVKAIEESFKEGQVLEALGENVRTNVNAEVILTEKSAHWDLMCE
ncbi:MAG: hypothetical protein HQL30_10610 [Candidatus Omnitrophica bacterium]|nr:hypothetical protein [Candidatus Omnitrophota bacterium]